MRERPNPVLVRTGSQHRAFLKVVQARRTIPRYGDTRDTGVRTSR